MSHRFQEKLKNVQLLTNDDGRKAIVTGHLIHPDDQNFVISLFLTVDVSLNTRKKNTDWSVFGLKRINFIVNLLIVKKNSPIAKRFIKLFV